MLWNLRQQVFQVFVDFQVVRLGCFYQAINHGTAIMLRMVAGSCSNYPTITYRGPHTSKFRTIHYCYRVFLLYAPLKILFPALVADGFLFRFPDFQAAEGDAVHFGKGLSAQASFISPRTDTVGLSVLEELAELVHKVPGGDAVELCQSFLHLPGNLPGNTCLHIFINVFSHTDTSGYLSLEQSTAVPQATEPLRNAPEFFISTSVGIIQVELKDI